jgi:hypothetical protein
MARPWTPSVLLSSKVKACDEISEADAAIMSYIQRQIDWRLSKGTNKLWIHCKISKIPMDTLY